MENLMSSIENKREYNFHKKVDQIGEDLIAFAKQIHQSGLYLNRKRWSSNNVPVCYVENQDLIDIYSSDRVNISTAHLEGHTVPLDKVDYYEEHGVNVRHAHGGTVDELHRIPYLINNPVAITTDPKTKDIPNRKKSYENINILCADILPDGTRKCYLIVAKPQSHAVDIPNVEISLGITTFLSIPETEFVDRLNKTLPGGNRDLLYFNPEQYERLPEMAALPGRQI